LLVRTLVKSGLWADFISKISVNESSPGASQNPIYCDYHCSHSIAVSADPWPDHVRLSDLEARFVCKACGRRGADVRPDFHYVPRAV